EKKKVEQVGEVTPPQQKESVTSPDVTDTTPKVGELNMPKTDVVAQADRQPGEGLTGEAAAFEQKDIYFDYDSFSIKPEDRKILAEKASYLNANPDAKVRIEGHCDERGTTEYNMALGERRAKAAQEYLVFLGISTDRITVISYGEEKPVDPGQSEEAWSKNRRDHFVLVK
ncbi:peptidoglycan-associated lipoprotein Pal, partial [archaeon]|nr:peptidoglycan-associated lipoprotein Pal [archaeon]